MINQSKCQQCHGKGRLDAELKNLGTRSYEWHNISCAMCDGKGYITQADRDRICTESHPQQKY